MKLLLAIAVGRAAAVTDVFLASDRLAASAAVLNSVCDNSDPTQLRLHLLAPTREEAETLARETETACDGAAVEPYGFAEFEKQVRTLGEEPMWTTALSQVKRSTSPYAVPVARWDRDKKHTSPYNHACCPASSDAFVLGSRRWRLACCSQRLCSRVVLYMGAHTAYQCKQELKTSQSCTKQQPHVLPQA